MNVVRVSPTEEKDVTIVARHNLKFASDNEKLHAEIDFLRKKNGELLQFQESSQHLEKVNVEL